MALKLDDRVKETSTTTGTGTLDLSGAVSGFQTFVAGIGNSNTTYYAIVNRDEAEWETGLGTVTDASTDTLARTTVISSSNSDSAVNFSAGTKDVFCTLPASKIANLDTNDNLTIGSGSAGVDYTLTFDGADSDGVLTWMEDEDLFKFTDVINVGVDDAGHDVKLFGATAGSYWLWDESADGVVQIGTLTVGVDDAGHDVKFFGNTASAYMLWDTSADDLVLAGAAGIDLAGDIDVDGTANLDVVDIDGATQIDGTVSIGVDGTGYDVKMFGDTASRYWLWDESADGVVQRGTLTVGVDDTGHDVKFFGASAGAYMEWDESADELRIMGASADATTSTGKLLLATSLTDINANDVIGKIDFQAPHEAGGTDAITVAASIRAIAQATFTSSVNATDLIFYTGHSEAAAEKVRITSQNEIGIAGANYGTDGQVLTSGGAGAAVAWEDVTGSVTAINNATDNELVTIGSTTTELDAEANLTFTGSALTCIGTVTVGVDDTGHDVKFFGATASKYMEWDESADTLNVAGTIAIPAGGAITNAGTMAPDITSTGKAMVLGF
jgi:hypothetical protein